MVAFLLELSALGVGFALVEKFLFVCVFRPRGSSLALCAVCNSRALAPSPQHRPRLPLTLRLPYALGVPYLYMYM